MRFNLRQALSRSLTFLAGVLLGLLLAASTGLAGAAPLRIGPPLPSPYYHIDRATPVASGRLDASYLESQCNSPRSAATTPGEWYVFSPTAGSWRHDHPWGPFHGLVIAQSPSGIWYRAGIGMDMYPSHEDAIATGLWSGSDWISEALLLPGAGRDYPAFLFQATSSTVYFRVPDFDCPDNTAGSVGDPAAYNERFLDWALYRVYFDSAAPVSALSLSGVPGDNGWFRSPVTASLSASDPEHLPGQPASGVAALSLNGAPYSGPLDISAQGSTELRFYATDNVGNLEAERRQNVRIDSGAPTLAVHDPGSAWSGTLSFSGTASDAVSGLALVQLSFDGGTSWQAATGTANWTYVLDTATLPDGPLAWQARALDQAGNSSLIASGSAVSDNSAPQVQITEPAGASVLSGSATLRGTASDAGAGLDRVEVSLDGGATWQLAAGTDSWVHLFDSASLSEGPLTLQARAIDLAGLVSPLDTRSVFVDNQAPGLSIDSPAAGSALRGSVTVTGSASDSGSGLDHVEVSLDGGATWTPATGAENWTYSFDASPLPDGPVTLQARAIDLAGLRSPLASRDYLLDQAPPVLNISAPVNGTPLAGMQTLSGGASDSGSGVALVEVSLDNGATWQPASGTNAWSLPFDTSALPEGPLSVLARATDHAGNVSSAATTADYLVDNGQPTLSITAPAPGSLVHETIQVSGAASDGGAGLDRVEVSLDGGASWLPASGTDSWTLPVDTTTLPDGPVSIQARAVDNAGNASPVEALGLTIDNGLPAVSISAPRPGSLLSGMVAVTGTASDSASGLDRIEVSLDNGVTWLPASGTDSWSYSLDTTTLADGLLTLQARSIDSAGNISPVASLDAQVDNTPASVQITSPLPGAFLSGPVQVGGSAADSGAGLSRVEVSLDNGASWQPASGTDAWTFDFDSLGLPEGPLNVQARAIDLAGNPGTVETRAVLLDHSTPTLTIQSPTPGSAVAGPVQIIGTAADSGSGVVRVEVSLDNGASWQPASGTDSWSFDLDSTTLPDGPLPLQVRATDGAGNQSSVATLALQVDNAPGLVAITSPGTGAVLSGQRQVSGTASDAGAGLDRVEVSLDDGASWQPAAGTDSWSFDLNTASLSDGPLTIQARSIDSAGNASPAESLALVVDNTAPTVQISLPLVGAALSGVIPVSGQAADSSSGVERVELSFDGGATWHRASGAGQWSLNWDTRALPDGPLSILARAVDRAGLTAQDQRPVSLGNGNSGSPSPATTPQTLPVSDPGPAIVIGDPALSKSGSPERARLGELITWTITVSNPGNQPIPDLVLLDPLPAGLEVLSAETPQGAHFIEGRTVRFVLGALQPGQTLTLTVLTRVTEGALGSDVCNTAQVPGLDASPAACVALIPDALPVTGGQPVEPFRLTLWHLLAGLVALLVVLLLVYGLRWERSL